MASIPLSRLAAATLKVKGIPLDSVGKFFGFEAGGFGDYLAETGMTSAEVDRFRELFGVDLYALAWAVAGDAEFRNLPEWSRAGIEALASDWRARNRELVEGVIRNL